MRGYSNAAATIHTLVSDADIRCVCLCRELDSPALHTHIQHGPDLGTTLAVVGTLLGCPHTLCCRHASWGMHLMHHSASHVPHIRQARGRVYMHVCVKGVGAAARGSYSGMLPFTVCTCTLFCRHAS